jgi:tetraacyldisaccharide 4'-kinase
MQQKTSNDIMLNWLHKLPALWHSQNAITYALWPVEWDYRLLILARQVLYQWAWFRQTRVNALVIVVGNVVVGGGGKTPLCIALVQRLQSQGKKVAVISRGYGRQSQNLQAVNDLSLVSQVGDEPLLIHQKCRVPVVVSRNRVEAAQWILQRDPSIEILVCDDGLQHLALHRDIEICVMDASGIGNGHLLPAGPLREPWPRPVNLLLHTHRRSFPEGYESNRQLSDVAISSDGTQVPLKSLENKALEVVSGIAKPEAFFAMLKARHLRIEKSTALPDHDNFSKWSPLSPHSQLVCTEKDAIKLWAIHPNALAIPLIFEPENNFWLDLDSQIASRRRYH